VWLLRYGDPYLQGLSAAILSHCDDPEEIQWLAAVAVIPTVALCLSPNLYTSQAGTRYEACNHHVQRHHVCMMLELQNTLEQLKLLHWLQASLSAIIIWSTSQDSYEGGRCNAVSSWHHINVQVREGRTLLIDSKIAFLNRNDLV